MLPRLLAAIFAVEGLIMLALQLHPVPVAFEPLVDAGLLAVLLAPIIHVLVVRPLRESNERHRAIVRAAADGILVVDHRGAVESANDAAERILGRPRAALELMHVDALVPGASMVWRARFSAAANAPSGRTAEGRVDAIRADGTAVPLALSVSRMTLEGHDHYTVILRDLTAEDARDRAMQQRITQLGALHTLGQHAASAHDQDQICRSALDAVATALAPHRCGLVLYDDAGVPSFRAWNGLSDAYRQAVEAWDVRNGAVCSRSAEPVRQIDTAALPNELAGAARAEGIAWVVRHTIVHDGRLIGRLMLYWDEPHVLDGNDLRVAQSIASHVAVVIERVRREADLRRLAQAVDATTDSIVVTDCEGRIQRVNRAFTTMSGFEPAEALGATPRLIRSGVQGNGFYSEMWKTIKAGRTWSGRLVNKRKDGTAYNASLAIAPVLDESGGVSGFVGVERDITVDIQREEELRGNTERLARACEELVTAKECAEDAARAKAEFLATMSHEIRTPMNGVLGFTHLLDDTALTDEQREFVTTIRNSGQTLLGLLNDILDFSKIEAGRMALEQIPFDLAQSLRDVVGLLRPQAGQRGVRLELEMEAGLPERFIGDPGRLRQVVTNLLGNALKFTPQGQVTVRVRLVPSCAHLRIEVADTGIGIPADKLGALFQQFAQVDASTTRRFGGTGLGLAISRRLVELMGGSIGVESEEGRGSTFWFTLPAPACASADEPAVAAAAAPARVRLEREGRPLSVLVAEDNAINQKLVRRMLERLGCSVRIANNGREAVELVATDAYDVVIMDCHMPEMDGFDATRAIRERRPRGTGLPIVALTASALSEDRQACMDAGMDDFLTKPIIPGLLRSCLERWAA